MAKTLAQILADARQIVFESDSSNTHFSDAQMTIWANEGYRRICVALRNVSKNRDYTAASGEITINDAQITIEKARLYNNDTGKYYELEVISLDRLIEIDPDFENAATNKPKYLAKVGPKAMRLHPPPDSDTTGQTLRVSGLEEPTALSGSTDIPDLPANLHDIIPNWIAQRAFFSIGNPERGTEQLTLFRGGLKNMTAVSREFSRSLGVMRWPAGDSDLA